MGIKASNEVGYNTKFGIVLSKRSAVPVVKNPVNLVASIDPVALDNSAASTLALNLLADFGINSGDVDMLYMDLPDTAPAQISSSAFQTTVATPTRVMRTDGVCDIISANSYDFMENAEAMGYNAYMLDLLPRDFVKNRLGKGMSADDLKWLNEWSDSLEITITKSPMHGKMVIDPKIDSKPSYLPDKNYIGKDRIEVEIRGKDLEGKAIAKKLIYFVNVVSREKMDSVIANHKSALKNYCGASNHIWRISEGGGASFVVAGLANDPSIQSAQLNSLIVGANASFQGFSDVAGSVVGTTDQNERITLSPTAAGHGWYLDPTPLDNTDDFLPTADPTIWRAKLGSAADGKMDMLSVLLHEYGHVLGLEHSADGHDFMGATLQPGERRLPTPNELAWMAQRVAELKAEQDGNLPADPAQRQPAYPAWGTANTATRQSRRSSNSTTGTATAAAAPPQFATAVNAQLTNGGFTQSRGKGDATL